MQKCNKFCIMTSILNWFHIRATKMSQKCRVAVARGAHNVSPYRVAVVPQNLKFFGFSIVSTLGDTTTTQQRHDTAISLFAHTLRQRHDSYIPPTFLWHHADAALLTQLLVLINSTLAMGKK